MSAYMPVKNSWSLDALLPGRIRLRVLRRALGGVVLFAVAVSVAALAVSQRQTGGLAQLPSGMSGSLVTQGVTATRDHGFLVVRGEAVNTGAKPANRLEAVVELFDSAGALQGVESALVEMPAIAAHDESPFVVHLHDPGQITSFRVRFRPLGSAVGR